MEIINKQKDDYQDLLLEIKDFYNYMVDETIEFMISHDCISPLEIYCLFNMLNNYYIKFDELVSLQYLKLIYSIKIENDDIRGVQVLLNSGVCRHRSAMLNDIYHNMGFDSVQMCGVSKTLLHFHYGNTPIKQLDDMKFVNNMLSRISNCTKIERFKSQLKERKITYNVQDVHDEYFIKHIAKPNHTIVMVGDDKRYYLDPTKDTVYFKDDIDSITYKNHAGDYFFSTLAMNTFYWTCWNKNQGVLDTYNRLIELPIANDLDTIKNIRNIYFYLREYEKDMENFTRSKSDSIEEVRKKCLSIPKD